jgi:hypothetical protein
MATNFPGPYEIRLLYSVSITSVVLNHRQRLSCAIAGDDPTVGTPFSSINVGRRAGGAIALDDAVDAYVALMKAFYPGSGASTIVSAELWKYQTETFQADFVSAYDIGVPGTSGSGPQSAAQSIVTMRTTNGGIFKLSYMESVIPFAVTDPGTFTNAGLEALVADIEAGNQPWLARDNGYPIVRIAHYPGQNEALFKKRYRTAS